MEPVHIPIPAGASPGQYRRAIGLYDPFHNTDYVFNSPEGSNYAVIIPVEITT